MFQKTFRGGETSGPKRFRGGFHAFSGLALCLPRETADTHTTNPSQPGSRWGCFGFLGPLWGVMLLNLESILSAFELQIERKRVATFQLGCFLIDETKAASIVHSGDCKRRICIEVGWRGTEQVSPILLRLKVSSVSADCI